MCGITGIYAYRDTAPDIDRNELRRMRDHMQSRGPDGKGEWVAPDGRVALGHRRLSIIDLSERAAQPMASQDGRYQITFNGEIYNYIALRKGLEARGRTFRTTSDTEVLLQLFAEKGADMLRDLRGMFAFAIWDTKKHVLFLARDPYGIKPLYYADDGHTLRFASQVKALLAGGAVPREPEPAGLAGFYVFGSVPEPWTCFRAIRALPSGSYLWVDRKGAGQPVAWFSLAETWRHAEEKQPEHGASSQEQIREALLDSVRHHLVADVPVGAFLSAGIDSGALVGLMKDAGQENIQTVTLAFDEFEGSQHDEAPLAAEIARRYGVNHTVRRVSETEFQEDLPKILAAMDQPSIDGLNTWFVSKAARELGLKVAVSGLGGDELFGGYPSFRDIPSWVARTSFANKLPGGRWMVNRLLEGLYRSPLGSLQPLAARPKLRGVFRYADSFAGAYLLRRGLYLPEELDSLDTRALLKEGLERLQPERLVNTFMQPVPGTAFAKVATLESSLYMRNQLLRDTDWASMAHSLEVRVPLVDSVLLQRLAPLLVQGQLDGKMALGNAPSRPLPDHVVNRPKTGFSTPIAKWQQRSADTVSQAPWARQWAKHVVQELAA